MPFDMPNPIGQSVEIELANNRLAVAFTGNAGEALHVAIGPVGDIFSDVVPPDVRSFQAHAGAASVGALWRPPQHPTQQIGDWSSPVWIEKSLTDGTQWLLYATFADDLSATVTEVPYPFPDGERGEIVTEVGQMPLLVDYSPSTDELLIAVLAFSTDSNIRVLPTRLPSYGHTRGRLVGTPGNGVLVSSRSTYEYVQFFDDTLNFEMFQIGIPAGDPFASTAEYPVSLVSNGYWPYGAIDGSYWIEGFDDAASSNLAYTDPYPTAVEAPDGDIYIWQFATSPGAEDFLTPFAHVSPGSRLLVPYNECTPNELWALTPAGTQIEFPDGDDTDVTSTALRSTSAPATAPWTTASITTPVLPLVGQIYFTADSRLYFIN